MEVLINLLEHFSRFLNNNITIAAEECSPNDIFLPASIAVGYTWNSAPIDGTNIFHSILAIGQDLYFPIDINLIALSKMTQNNAQVAFDYLKLTAYSHPYSTSILNIFIENSRTRSSRKTYERYAKPCCFETW